MILYEIDSIENEIALILYEINLISYEIGPRENKIGAIENEIILISNEIGAIENKIGAISNSIEHRENRIREREKFLNSRQQTFAWRMWDVSVSASALILRATLRSLIILCERGKGFGIGLPGLPFVRDFSPINCRRKFFCDNRGVFESSGFTGKIDIEGFSHI